MSLTGLIDVIHWLEDVFERLELRRSYGGAIAYNYYAPPRFTQEMDALALIPDTKDAEWRLAGIAVDDLKQGAVGV